MAQFDFNGLLGNPQTMGLLGMSAGLLQAGGPSRLPVNTGQAISQGLLGGMQMAQTGRQHQTAEELRQLQISEAKRKQQEHEEQRAIRARLMSGLFPAGGAAPQPQEIPAGLSPQSADAIGASWAARPESLPQVPQQGGSPSMNGVDPNAMLMALFGDAGLQKIGGWIQESRKPTDRMREAISLGLQPGTPQFNAYVGTQYNQGGAWQVQPDGSLALAPGYAGGMGQVKSAEEQARAALDLIELPTGAGGTQFLTRLDASRRLSPGGGQPQPVQRGSGSIVEAPAGMRDRTNSPSPRSLPPTTGGLGFRQPASVTAAETEFAKQAAGDFAKHYNDILQREFAAPAQLGKYGQLQSLLSGVATGKFASTTQQIKAAAKAAGIDVSLMGDDLPQAQAAQALSGQLALELRNPSGGAGMPGAMSDKDREFLQAMVPGLENDPRAIPLMIDYRKRLAERDQQIGRMARAYKKRTGRFDEGFLEELSVWSDKNPIFKDKDRQKLPNGGFRVLGVEGQ